MIEEGSQDISAEKTGFSHIIEKYSIETYKIKLKNRQ
jgi:hypothetical protein